THVRRLAATVLADPTAAEHGRAPLSERRGDRRKPYSDPAGVASAGCGRGHAAHGARRSRHGRADRRVAGRPVHERILAVTRTLARQIVSALAATFALTVLVFVL